MKTNQELQALLETPAGTEERESRSTTSLEDDASECLAQPFSGSHGNSRRGVRYVHSNLFSTKSASKWISMVSVPGMPTVLAPRDRLSYMTHLVGPERDPSFRCVGALLHFLVQNDILNSLEQDDHPIGISSIAQKSFTSSLQVSKETARALDIFHQDIHPLGSGYGKAKEGVSLYGILNRTKTSSGARMLRRWLSLPSVDTNVISERQLVVDVLRAPINEPCFETIRDELRGVSSVLSALTHIRSFSATFNDWISLSKSVKSFLAIIGAFKTLTDPEVKEAYLYQRATAVEETYLRQTIDWVGAVVDVGESRSLGRTVVVPGFSEDIDKMREVYVGLDSFLTEIAVEEMEKTASEHNLILPQMQVVYFPQIGYLVRIDEQVLAADQVSEQQLAHVGLQLLFCTQGDGGYYKNQRCRELDDSLGDIHGALLGLEAKAVRYLESKILPLAPHLCLAAEVVCEIDCLISLAVVAKESEWIRPVVTQDCASIEIDRGRHAIQELVVPSFIANSTSASPGSIHVVTGPNRSGKSVYCKQVALIVILAHVGSCVPAKSCRLGVFDRIFARSMGTEAGIEGQSAFFADASRVAGALRQANERTLILLDEWGKGTNEVDGASLLAATLRSVLATPADRAPTCLVATHFSEVLASPILPIGSDRLRTYSMDFIMDTDGSRSPSSDHTMVAPGSVAGTTVYLYKLLHGSICTESRAFHCALDVGVPRPIVLRGIEILDAVQNRRALPTHSQDERSRLSNILANVKALFDADLSDPSLSVDEFLGSLQV